MEMLGRYTREDMISSSFTTATEPLAARRRCVLPFVKRRGEGYSRVALGFIMIVVGIIGYSQ